MSQTYADFLNDLAARESGGDYTVINQLGYVGKYQFGESALIDAGYYNRDGTKKNDWSGQWTNKDGVNSLADFRSNPTAQENAIHAYMNKQWSYIEHFDLDQYIGRTINGTEITESGLLGGAHLMGIGGLRTYLRSNGETIPQDGNGTPITEYIEKFSGYLTDGDTTTIATLNKSAIQLKPEEKTILNLLLIKSDYILNKTEGWVSGLAEKVMNLLGSELNDVIQSLSDSTFNAEKHISNYQNNVIKIQNTNTTVLLNETAGTLEIGSTGVTYVIQLGDTLSKIATKNDLSLQQLLSLNLQINDPHHINIGQLIFIPYKSMPTGNIGQTSGQIGMFNTYNLSTGELIGSATISDGSIYNGLSIDLISPSNPNNNTFTLNTEQTLASYVNYLTDITTSNDSYIADVADLRGLTGVQKASENWGGNIRLDAYTNTHSFANNVLQNTNPNAPTNNYVKFDGSDWYYLQNTYIQHNQDNPNDSLNNNTGQIGMFNTFNLSGRNDISLTLGNFNSSIYSYTDYYMQDTSSRSWTNTDKLGNPLSTLNSHNIFNLTNTLNSNTQSNFGFNGYLATQQTTQTYSDLWQTSDQIAANGLLDAFSAILYHYFSPVVLDLDSDGIELIQQKDSQAYYDVKDTGYRNHVGWINPDDGILAIDINGDGQISQAAEVSFALWTSTPFDTDIEGLRTVFDSNQNGKLDAGDAQYAHLKLWQDKNANGISEAGELKTLAEAGIVSLDLNTSKTNWTSGGNHISGFSSYTKVDGSQHYAADVALGFDQIGWNKNTEGSLVNMTQSGGLTYALATDSAITLNINGTDKQGVYGNKGDDKLTGTGKQAVMLDGGAGDDTLIGGRGDDWLSGGTGVDRFKGGSGDDTLVIDSTDKLSYLNGGRGYDTVVVTGNTGVSINLSARKVEVAIGSEGNDTFTTSKSSRVVLTGEGGNDTLIARHNNDILEGGTGDDFLQGKAGNDYYLFNRGDGKDTIDEQGYGQTKIAYIADYKLVRKLIPGYEDLRIYENVLVPIIKYRNGVIDSTKDTLLFGEDIDASDILIAKNGKDLLVAIQPKNNLLPDDLSTEAKLLTYIKSLSDHITIVNWAEQYDKVENISFADGSTFALSRWIAGTSHSDFGGQALVGSSKSDLLSGGLGGDEMVGNAGNDAYVVDHINDVVVERASQGIDTIYSSVTYTLTAFTEHILLTGMSVISATGNHLNNKLFGNSGNNTLKGEDGNDTLNGGLGADSLLGGEGNDTYVIDDANDVIIEHANIGVDTVVSSLLTYTLAANLEHLTLGAMAGSATGNTLNNKMTGNALNNTLDGGKGHDTLIGDAGNDVYLVDSKTDVVIEKSNKGNDTVIASLDYTLGQTIENLTLSNAVGVNNQLAELGVGNAYANVITGNARDNTLKGGAGNDTIDGGLGVDTMLGGTGNDTYIIGNAEDKTIENAKEGTDTVLSNLSFYQLESNIENLTLTGKGVANGSGNTIHNSILGNSASNILDGGMGNDTLNGQAGKDTLIGGAGNDTYYIDNAGDVVEEVSAAGIDTVISDVNYVLGDFVEHLWLTDNQYVSVLSAKNATGNTLNNFIKGNAAANFINGLTGNDTMQGGDGDDNYIVDSVKDVIKEVVNEGIDTIISSVSITGLAANIEHLTLVNEALSAVGNKLNNRIVGNELDNKLSGSTGNDTLIGGAGADKLNGGAGNDTYWVDTLADKVVETNAEGENLGGIDTIYSDMNYTLSNYFEHLFLTENLNTLGANATLATGNSLHNHIVGNTANNSLIGLTGNDTLDGGGGDDTLTGGVGNDVYIVDSVNDVALELANQGLDTIVSYIDSTLLAFANIENITLTGDSAVNAIGNASANMLIGNAKNNLLIGGEGAVADTLDGSAGSDTMRGGAGDDVYYVDQSDTYTSGKITKLGDTVEEAIDEGKDTVFSTIAYSLSKYVENLTLTGFDHLNGTGNDSENLIIGNTGNNKLDGSIGADSLIGGKGDDIYVVDNVLDSVSELVNSGIDLILSSVSFNLTDTDGKGVNGSNVENLTLTDSAALNATGNALANVLIGNQANNLLKGLDGDDTLDGGSGADTMDGGAGNNTYIIDDVDDEIVKPAVTGVNVVFSKITSYVLVDQLDNLTLLADAMSGGGNATNNIITGNQYNNILDGKAGNDTLRGGIGDDTLIGGAGADFYIVDSEEDVVIEFGDAGVDQVESSVSYLLSSYVENLTLIDDDEIDATGNTLNNKLIGNVSDNVLDGMAGADTLAGGYGDDTYILDSLSDVITELVDQGEDDVQTSVSYTLGANLENLTLANDLIINGTGNALNNILLGNDEENFLKGLAGSDILFGGAGADDLSGGDGDDDLDGGYGDDVMSGGLGNDVYTVDSSEDKVVEALNQGIDTVFTNHSYVLGANIENLTLNGEEDINGTGNSLDNILIGNLAINVLVGGAGDDIYQVNSLDDCVIEKTKEGNDTVISGITFSLFDTDGDGLDGANIENLTLIGDDEIDGKGNDLANILVGNDASNTLTAYGGNDTLNGGLGLDRALGGLGDDVYYVDEVLDIVFESTDQGLDEVRSIAEGYTLADNLEYLVLLETANIDGTGNTAKNRLTGNVGDNVLDGGAGADTLIGGFGDDTYVIDNTSDFVTEKASEGNDTINASVTYSLTDTDGVGGNGAYVENLTLVGELSIDSTGNSLANLLTGNQANNWIKGLGGDDTLDGGDGVDTLEGGAGNNTYVVNSVDDLIVKSVATGINTVMSSVNYQLVDYLDNLTLTDDAVNGIGNAIANSIIGNDEDNTLEGLAGNDTLDGAIGADTMSGGAGNDSYFVDDIGDVVVEVNDLGVDQGGTDTINSMVSLELSNAFEHLTLLGEAAINATGNSINNRLIGNSAENLLDGGVGVDTMVGGLGDDVYKVDNITDRISEKLEEGLDTVESTVSYSLVDTDYTGAFGAYVENLTLVGVGNINATGNALDNLLKGNIAVNKLTAGAGDDTLDGGLGSDSMIGGAGNDTYIVDNLLDVVTEALNSGFDTILSSLTYSLLDTDGTGTSGNNVENLSLINDQHIDATGNLLANRLIGNSGNNHLIGLAGKDTLNGGEGEDVLEGGLADDFYIIDSSFDVVVESFNEGIDTIQSAVTILALAFNVENLLLQSGTDPLDGTGNILNNIITGNDGGNQLDGSKGNDTLIGGAGNDIYLVDAVTDVVMESVDEGFDIVNSAANTYTLSDNIENLTLVGVMSSAAIGNQLSNLLIGNVSNNVLNGLDGDDSIDGAEGDDLLNGNLGADNLDGGMGADTLLGGNGDDSYIVNQSNDVATELGDEGFDSIFSSVSYTLQDNIESLVLTGLATIAIGNELDNNLLGNDQANLLFGYAGADILDGAIGPDTLQGGLGHDVYRIDSEYDVIIEKDELYSGIDTIESLITLNQLTLNIENITLLGEVNLNAKGNFLNNILKGNNANNHLDGDMGVDTMIGGVGDDTYIVGDTADVVLEQGNEGVDAVISSVSYSLNSANGELENTRHVEYLTLIGVANYSATGNALHNKLLGNVGDNTLNGLAGSDTLDGGLGKDLLIGGAGDDNYFIDTLTDDLVEDADGGIDTIFSSVSYTLQANFEYLVLTGSLALNATGSNNNDRLSGNDSNNLLTALNGDDTLDGASGADTLIGGLGDDIYYMDTTREVVTEASDEGQDIVYSSVDVLRLAENVEALVLIDDARNVLGNGSANLIRGNTANNVLDGGLGTDTMQGGMGDDIYIVDSISDVIQEEANEGLDAVESTALNFVLGANIENITLIGGGAINASGNQLNNLMIGNFGNNLLLAFEGKDTLDGLYGFDTLVGGTGDDTYIVISSGVSLVELQSQGLDTVLSNISFSLKDTDGDGIHGGNIENITLTGSLKLNATGNELDNTLIGNNAANLINGAAGNDTLYGGLGLDTLNGGLGDDIYIVDSSNKKLIESFTLADGGGVDVVHSTVSKVLETNIDDLTLLGMLNIYGKGNAIDNEIIGNTGDNLLNGFAGADVLSGGLGDDTLDGGLGNDKLDGSYGDDVYILDLVVIGKGKLSSASQLADEIVEKANGGSDTLILRGVVTLTLASTVTINDTALENLDASATGTSKLNLTGNQFDNLLTGNTANNTILGFEGNDTLIGGLGLDTLVGGVGNDVYVVDNIGDKLVEKAAEGIDTVKSSVTYSLVDTDVSDNNRNNIEHMTLTGKSAINASGNALSNYLIGNSNANTLQGNAGDDTLDGGLGKDLLVGGLGADIFTLSSAPSLVNIDIIKDFEHGVDRVELKSQTFKALSDGQNLFDHLLVGTKGIKALDANDFLIFNTATKALYYDDDANGAGVAIQIATLNGVAMITADDFVVS